MDRSKVHRLVKLDADENIIKIIHQHKIKYWNSFLLQFLFLLIATLLLVFFNEKGTWVYILSLVLFLSVIVWILILWQKWHSTVLVLTNNRLVDIHQVSLWEKQVAMVDLAKIEEIRITSHAISKLLWKYGRIEIFLPNGNLSLRFDYVLNPDKIQELIYQLQKRYNPQSEEFLSVDTQDLVKEISEKLRTKDKEDLLKIILGFRKKMGLEQWGAFLNKKLED